MTLPVPPSQVFGQVLAWAGSAVAAAAVLSGVAALVATLPAPGQSRGQVLAPVILTLEGPKAVAALPTPPPQVSSLAPDAPPPLDAATRNSAPATDATSPSAAAPRLPAPAMMADLPRVPDPLPTPPEPTAPTPAPPAPQKPAPAPAPLKTAKPVAENSGAASVAGDAGKTAKATRSDGVKAGTDGSKAAMQRWSATIRARIEARKAYPASALGAQGSVTVRLTVSRSGLLLGVSVARSSGVAALDRAAVKAVQSAHFPKAPDAVAQDSTSFSLPMKFSK